MLAYTQPGFTSIPMSDVSSSCVGKNCRHVDWWMLGYPVMLDQSPTGYVGLPVVLLVNMHNKHNVNGECSGRLCRSMWLILIKSVIIIYSLMVNVHVYSIVMNVIPLLKL